MRYLIAILLGLLAAGCGNKAVDNLMSQASMLIEEHPDSALLALRQIDPSAISPAADARRRLLLAQTYSRTGAEADKDSLTAPALDYYERHGSGAERAYAWYFDAKVHHNAGDRLVATARVKQQGKLTGVYDIEIVNQQQKIVALFRGKSHRIGGTITGDV